MAEEKLWGYMGYEPDEIPKDLTPTDQPKKKTRLTQGRKTLTKGERVRRKKAMQRAIVDAVTCDDLANVTRAMVEKAIAGDVNAARLVFDRLLGRLPTESTQNLNVHEDKALAVHFQSMSVRELEALERQLLNPSIEAEARVIK